MIPARREIIEAFAAEEYRKHFSAMEGPPLAVLEMVRLMDKREFIFRGRAYRVPPVPWRLAAELLDCRERMKLVQADTPIEVSIALFKRVAELTKRACYPAGLLRRAFWRITLNPFQRATPWEVGRHLGFFSMCIGLDQVQPSEKLQQGASSPGTSSLTSLVSRSISLRGRIETATRSPGATS